jgi:hypothetical protein
MYDTRGRGDGGSMSTALYISDETGEVVYEHDARPRVGVAMRVGSLVGRSFSSQDYWTTTIITEIVEDTPDKVVFKTRSGSTYTWETH